METESVSPPEAPNRDKQIDQDLPRASDLRSKFDSIVDEIENDLKTIQVTRPFFEYHVWMEDVLLALISWGVDVRLSDGSLDALSPRSPTALNIQRALLNIRNQLSRIAMLRDSAQREAKEDVTRSIIELKSYVRTVRMIHASMTGQGPYASIRSKAQSISGGVSSSKSHSSEAHDGRPESFSLQSMVDELFVDNKLLESCSDISEDGSERSIPTGLVSIARENTKMSLPQSMIFRPVILPPTLDDENDIGDGGDAFEGLFKRTFQNEGPDTWPALMKSNRESGGTALSARWDKVSRESVELELSKGDPHGVIASSGTHSFPAFPTESTPSVDVIERSLGQPYKSDFAFSKLDPGGIRLFKLRKGGVNDPLVVDITTYPAQTTQPGGAHAHMVYDAISYVWTRAVQMTTVQAHSETSHGEILINASLGSALRVFRKKGAGYLWADSLCLNFDDREEMDLALMSIPLIFQNAHNAQVWLGEKKIADSGAIGGIEDNSQTFPKMYGMATSGPKDSKTDSSIFEDMLASEWFRLRWVLQEIAHARSVTFSFGNFSIPWETLNMMSEAIREADPYAYSPVKTISQILNDGFARSKDGRILDRRLGMETLISSLSMFETGVPHDFVYSLLSLARDSGYQVYKRENTTSLIEPQESVFVKPDSPAIEIFSGEREREPTPGAEAEINDLRRLLLVDYSEDILELCRNFTAFSILTSGSLDIICRAWAPVFDNGESCPSWIQNVSKTSHTWDGQHKRYERENADSLVGDGITSTQRFRASGVFRVAHKLQDQLMWGMQLHVRGFAIDVVYRVRHWEDSGLSWRELGKNGLGWRELVGWLDLSQPPPEKFWKTLVAGSKPHYQKAVPSNWSLACQFAYEREYRNTLHGLGSMGSVLLPAHVPDFLAQAEAVTWERSLALMSGNNTHELLVLGPPGMEDGDVVCILYGCSVPVVLRECSTTTSTKPRHMSDITEWKFIGECYIDGMMYGEALAHREKTGNPVRDFTLV